MGYGNLILISWDITPLAMVIYTHLSQCLLIELSSASITFIDERRCETVKEWALIHLRAKNKCPPLNMVAWIVIGGP